MKIKGLKFVLTCSACPEQYDVYDDRENLVGYVRLRWGGLSCSYPCVGGEQIYYANIGDCWAGCFESNDQRIFYLCEIADKILERLSCKGDPDVRDGFFTSVWDGGYEVTTPCRVDMVTGRVFDIGQVDVDADALEEEYVTVDGVRYCLFLSGSEDYYITKE